MRFPTGQCSICREPDRESRLEYAPYAQVHCHRACVLAALARDQERERVLPLARELGLTGPAPGRIALECRRGHPLEGANVLVSHSQGRSWRNCRRCHLERKRDWLKTAAGRAQTKKRQERVKAANWQRTHCGNGHEYTAATTLTGTHGEKKCRECLGKAGKAGMSARWRGAGAQGGASGPEAGR